MRGEWGSRCTPAAEQSKTFFFSFFFVLQDQSLRGLANQETKKWNMAVRGSELTKRSLVPSGKEREERGERKPRLNGGVELCNGLWVLHVCF